jgi:hypothetical protein
MNKKENSNPDYKRKKDISIGSNGQQQSDYVKVRCTSDLIGPGSFNPNYFFRNPSRSFSFPRSKRFTTKSKSYNYKNNIKNVEEKLIDA